MPVRQIHKTKGKCVRCEQIITSAIASSHILACYGYHQANNSSSVTPPKASSSSSAKGSTSKAAPSSSSSSSPSSLELPGFLIRISFAYKPELYWMFIRTPKDKTLNNLDDFLRAIWLECCGHGSQFTINGRNYVSFDTGERETDNLSKKLSTVLAPGTIFSHLYDFGTSTELVLQVIQEVTCPKNAIDILMRNVAPAYKCDCKKPATIDCGECDEYLCKKCSRRHPCASRDDYMLNTISNSPRSGVCGYTGPDQEGGDDDDDDDDDEEEEEDE